MYICDSSVVVTGIASCEAEGAHAEIIRAQTLDALKQISTRLEQLEPQQLEKAFSDYYVYHPQRHS